MDVLDRINELLDSDETDTAPTSMRLPKALREAAALAVSELGAASSATALTAQALRGVLEGIVMQAALEAHFVQYPSARPSLGELAVAAAGLDGHPLATRPELLHRAAIEISQRHPGATADDVLLWAEARSLAA